MSNKKQTVVTISNQKGGVGKTTVAQIMGAILSKRGKRVLLVDADPQLNLSMHMGAQTRDRTFYEVMRGRCRIADAIQSIDGYDIVASSMDLGGIDAELVSDPYSLLYQLRDSLNELEGSNPYDYIIIDTPRAIGPIFYNAIVASDELIIPTDPDMYGISGIAQLSTSVKKLQDRGVSRVRVNGILLNMTPKRWNDKPLIEMAARLAGIMGTSVYDQRIRPAKLIRDAKINGRDLVASGKQAPIMEDFNGFVDEFLTRTKKHQKEDR